MKLNIRQWFEIIQAEYKQEKKLMLSKMQYNKQTEKEIKAIYKWEEKYKCH